MNVRVRTKIGSFLAVVSNELRKKFRPKNIVMEVMVNA